MRQAGYEWVTVDMEHGAISQHKMPNLFRALWLGGTLPLVRLADGTAIECKQAINAGAGVVSVSMVESAQQMERVRLGALAGGAVKTYRVLAREVVRFGFRRLCRIGSGTRVDRDDRACLGGQATGKSLSLVKQLNTMHSMGRESAMALPDRCPLCSSGRESLSIVTSHVYGDKFASHGFFHCAVCDVRYQFPSLTSDEAARFYEAEFEGFMASRSDGSAGWLKAEQHLVANELTRLRRMKYLAPYITKAVDILEVGCSSGFMLFPLGEAGHRCTGIEPSGVFSEFVRERGLPVYQSLEELQCGVPQAKFDLILHFFVLEHIASPGAFLRQQLSMLKSGGHILFEIPNAADPLYAVYDIPAFERFYWSVAHPWCFSEPSLHFLLRQLGEQYEVLRDQRYNLSNHIIWARDGQPGGIGRFTPQLGADVEESYKKSLISSGKCDTLIGIIRKDGAT